MLDCGMVFNPITATNKSNKMKKRNRRNVGTATKHRKKERPEGVTFNYEIVLQRASNPNYSYQGSPKEIERRRMVDAVIAATKRMPQFKVIENPSYRWAMTTKLYVMSEDEVIFLTLMAKDVIFRVYKYS
jgi:hypothetical protein